MKLTSPRAASRNMRVFTACLISFNLLLTPLVAIAAAGTGISMTLRETSSSPTNAPKNVSLKLAIPEPAPEPAALIAPVIVATKDDGLAAATAVAPGSTITYTVNIKNNGVNTPADDATNVQFNDTIDSHTTLVPGSPVAAVSDKYNTIGNVQISVPAPGLLTNDFDPDTGNNAGMTATAETKSSTQCAGCNNVTINANGSFTYDPKIGFSGTDTFTYTAHSGSATASETVTVTVSNEIWFINNNAGACTASCDGRLSHPFTSISAFNAANLGGAGQPGDNDWIFVYESATAYTGPVALRPGQKFIGQDATANLTSLTGFTQPSGTDPLPVMNAGNGTIVQLTTSAAATNGINLNSGNTLRGFTVGNTTGAKIAGNNFGTLLVGNNSSPDVTLNGSGQALNLTTGTLSVTGGFVSVTTTSSSAQGINLSGVADSDGAAAGSFSFGSTTVSGSSTQGILIGTTTADLNFGNTSVSGGTDGISFQNNASGTRTMGTLNVAGGSGRAFLHGAGGGNVTITGAATLSSSNSAIDVSSPAATNLISFQGTTSATSTGAGNTAVNWNGVAGASLTFNALTIQRNNATALNATGGGTVNVTNATGSINNTTAGGPAIVANGVALNTNFTAINSTAGTNAVSLTNVTGTSSWNGGSLTGTATGPTFLVTGGTTSVTYSGGITQANNNAMVSIAGGHSTGTITFQTGTLSASNGTGLQFDNADGTYNFNGTTTLNGGDAGIDITNGSTGTFSFPSTSINSPTGTAFNVNGGAPNVTFASTVTQNNAARVVDIQGTTGGAISFTDTNTAVTGGASSLGVHIGDSSAVNGNVTFAELNLGTSGARMTNPAVTINNGGSGAVYSLGTVTIFTSGAKGLVCTNSDGTLNVAGGSIDSSSATAIDIDGPVGLTTLGISLTSVTSGGGTADGISIQDTNGSFTVNGDGSNTAVGGNSTGGTISNKTGADNNVTQGIGVYLNNVTNITLRRITINGTNQNFGIRGFAINNFTLEYSTVNGTNGNNPAPAVPNGAGEGSIYFGNDTNTGITGTGTITNCIIAGGRARNMSVINISGTLNRLVITGSNFGLNQSFVDASDSLSVESRNSGTVLNATVRGNTFTGAPGDLVEFVANSQSTMDLIMGGPAAGQPNALSNNHPNNNVGGGGVTIASGGTLTFNVSNNTMRDANGSAITLQMATPGAGSPLLRSVNGTFNANTIGVSGVPNSGSATANGIFLSFADNQTAPRSQATVAITNNIIRRYNGIAAISADNTGGSYQVNLTITGNTTSEPGGTAFGGLVLGAGGVSSSDDVDVCASITGNNFSAGSPTSPDVFVIVSSGNSSIQLPGLTTPATQAGIESFILSNNNTAGTTVSANTDAPATFAGNYLGGAACTSPSAMAQPLDPSRTNFVINNVRRQLTTGGSLSLNSRTEVSSNRTTQSALPTSTKDVKPSRQVVLAATAENQTANTYPVSPALSASSSMNSVQGWTTVAQVQEPTTQQAKTRNALQVRSHHASHTSKLQTTAERRQKSLLKIENSDATGKALRKSQPLAVPVSGETVTANIGTLAAGSSVTITYQVTVNNPPNQSLLGPARIENQGTVTANGGISVLTDDPDFGGAADKTRTLIDLFDTTTTLASDLNPSNFGDQVTLTATVAETPTQASVDPTGTVDFIDTSNGNAVICNDVTLSAGSAQCQTSSLTAGTHNIRADYAGDGNFDPSQSNVVAQVVNACTPNPIVTSTGDSGAGTLRDALAQVCSGTTITFDLAGGGPHSITLTSGELAVAKNVTIKNNSGESITVSGNNVSRVFNINSGKTASIIGLTISGGQNGGNGGGILNDGALTVVNSTITGNSASGDGGGVATSALATSLTLLNTTISGNNANGNGGGVAVLGGTMTSINSTLTNNKADNDNNATGTGGGILGNSTTTLKNTIVAGNLNGDGGAGVADDIGGTVDAASSFNLIGDAATAGGLVQGTNGNIVGNAGSGTIAITSVLNPTLANNGGATSTHALVASGLAVESGSNANLPADTFDLDGDANTAETLPVDGRGVGFPRTADSADANTTQTVDIGAFELHPAIEDIANQTSNEDTVKNVSFNIGDDTGSLIASVTATSSNTTLVPNANLVISGTGGGRNLQITPAANQSGTTTVTVTVTATNGRTATDTFDLTVSAVNDAPVANADAYATNEDTALTVNAATGVLFNDTDIDTPPGSLTAVLVSGPANALSFTLNGDGSFNYTPSANFNGTDSFTYKANDGSADSNVATVTITVTPVNDAPALQNNTGLTVAEGSTNNAITSAMLSVSDIDNTATQIVYTVGTGPAHGTLKKSGVGLAAGGTFTQDDLNNNRITYDHDGSNTTADSFSFTVSDGAGGSLGLTTFNITITAVDDAPSITAGGTLNYTENDAATAIDTTITVTDGDSTNLASATVQVTGNYANGQDVLSFTNTATITGSFNAGTGTLTLTGSDTVANYQAALRAVKYNNTSENPATAARTVSWTVNDGTLNSNQASSTINVAAVDDGPVNTVPGPQSTNQNTPLIFSSGNSNQISIADIDAGSNGVQVTLTATNGTLTLNGASGLSFSFSDGNGTGAGDGTADTTMRFRGTMANINSALNGMTFTPTAGFSGAASLTITTNDLGNSGANGPLSDSDVVNIQVATNISIQDAQVVEPASGTVNMIFTVTLSAPAPAGGAAVNFTTQEQAPALNHATAGQDYTTTAGTVNFAAGEQFKTILVPVLSDSKKNEQNETFLVVLSNPVNATLADGTATGTILISNQAGTILISELRTSGPGGAGDDFVEIFNNSTAPHTVNGPGGGYGLFKMGASCSDTPVLIGVIPNGTVIPARGHYLFVGSAYSLADYGGTGAAAGDQTLSADIESDRNVALFSTATVDGISTANRLDAVGFGANTGGVCDLLREGTTLTPTVGSVLEYTYFRDECGKKGNPSTFGPCPTGGLVKDSNVNRDDFIFADTNASLTPAGQRLGAPGPQKLGSPRTTVDVLVLLLDATKSNAGTPNRVRDTSAAAIGPNAAQGTMSIRRRFVNSTGAPVTRLRIRVVDISTAPVTGGTADLRLLSSGNVTVSVNDAATCTAAGFASTPCNVTVVGTTLETPPAQALGGGFNSSVTTATITLGTPLAAGASVNLQLLLGVQTTGGFKFFFNVEALP